MPEIHKLLQSFGRHGPAFNPCAGFNDTLVIGYAIASKPEIALHLFGKMRQIRMRDFENWYTNELVTRVCASRGGWMRLKGSCLARWMVARSFRVLR
ncbi:uncharacterized protein DS421_18g620450 [Arachis hypogaea]|nr:uncharacterized protein DS421_18g620450 [Arachis hypogaea]